MYRISIFLAFLTLLPSSDAMPQQSLERIFRGYTESPKYILAKPRPKQWTLGSSSPSRNAPQPIPSDSPYADKGVQLIVRPQESELFREEYEGFAILLVNAASYHVSLGRCYRCLPIHREALDPDGVWEEIEFLDCPNGDGYSAVDVLPGQYYRFAAPRLAGTYQTWMRFRLGSYIFSNEFYGTMDRDQFRYLPNTSNLHEISGEDLERLPVDNLQEAVGLLPGVVVTGGHPR